MPTTTLMPLPKQQFLSITGSPLAGGKLFTYAAGTSQPKETFTDPAGTVPQENPITLNLRGEPDSPIYWSGNYRIELRTGGFLSKHVYTVDNFNSDPGDIFGLNGALSGGAGAGKVGYDNAGVFPPGSVGAILKTLLNYVGRGVGAIPRPIYDKISDRVSVKDYVVGDGVADDTEALRRFFAQTGELFWDPGVVCAISSQIVIPRSNFQLRAGAGAKVVATAAMPSMFLAKDKNKVSFTGLEFDLGDRTQIGIHFRADIDNPDGLDVFGCTFYGASLDETLQYAPVCVDAIGGAGGSFKPSNVRINGNRIRNCKTHGCIVAYCDRVEFHNNWVNSVRNHGMEAVQSTNVSIIGNKVKSCGISGLGCGTFCQNVVISDNLMDDCAGDATITVEHNDINVRVHDNVCTNCRTTGLNISFGTGGVSPFNKVQRISAHDNYFQAAPGVTTYAGANIYSTTTGGEGTAIHLHHNTFVGFNGGLTAAYLKYCSFKDNIVTDLTGVNTYLAKLTYVTFSEVSGWKCDSNTSDHAIQLLDYVGTSCTRITVHDNYVQECGSSTKSIVYIEGTGDHLIYANGTNGALNYIRAVSTASYKHGGNFGNIAGTATSGGNPSPWQ